MSKDKLTEEDVIRYLEECNESQDILGFCYIPEMVCSKILALYQKEKQKNKKLESRKYMLNAETEEVTAIPIDNNYILKSKVREKIEERYGTLCMELGSYVRDEATPEQERIAGGMNELRKLKNEFLQEGDK